MKLIILSFALIFASQVLAEPPKSSPALLAQGKKAYGMYCLPCHGAKGVGDGPSAATINPKPRNFIKDPFKFGTKPEEVFKTITNGSPGTAMAPFMAIPEQDRWALAYYVLSLRKK